MLPRPEGPKSRWAGNLSSKSLYQASCYEEPHIDTWHTFKQALATSQKLKKQKPKTKLIQALLGTQEPRKATGPFLRSLKCLKSNK